MKAMRLMGAVQGALACFVLIIAHSSFAQGSGVPGLPPINIRIPVVTIRATDPLATWSGNPGVFTVTRTGNPLPSLFVYYQVTGTASNGVDYHTIGNWITIPSGVLCGDIVIKPIDLGQSATKTVVLTLTNSPLMGPGSMLVNYIIGSPNRAAVYITPGPVTNVPPEVSVVYPADGSGFCAPVNIPIIACARDLDGSVTGVEFFADDVSFGIVTNPVFILPPMIGPVTALPPMPPYRPFVLVWTNAPVGPHLLTAKATDDGGASTLSDPVHVAVNPGPPPPPTNFPPIVRITSPANNSVFWAPVNLPLFAFAADLDGYVTNVEFYAGSIDLGPGHPVRVAPPPLPPGSIQPPILIVRPTNYWTLDWSNAPQGNYALTAVATDNRGTSAGSDTVNVSLLPPLPPPSITNVVGILATDPIAIEGTNCWPWLGLAACSPTWANWTASSAVCRYFTNCGPKDAVFSVWRLGETNADLAVAYSTAGTASNGVEYVTLPGTVTIPAGQRAALITVVPIDDGLPDMTSTVILKLTPSAEYLVDPRRSTAAAIILDRPTPSPGATVLPDRCFHINSTGPDGAWVRVESSSDLRNWTSICTNQVFNGSFDFIDPDAQSNQFRFYRTVSEANPTP